MLVCWIYLSGSGLRQRAHHAENFLTPVQSKARVLLSEYGITGDEQATVEALTLGYRGDLSRDLRYHFQAAGAMHVLAVSGLHTGILYAIIYSLLTIGGMCKPMYENRLGVCALSGIIILIMWLFACLTGLSPSVVRSVTMITVVEVARMIRREAWSLNTLFVSVFFILLFSPGELHSVGFWLSCLAVGALLICKPRNLITVSLVAQMGTLPLSLYLFGQISNYFLLTNLIVIPLATIILTLTMTFYALCWIPTIGGMIARLLSFVTWVLNHSVAWIESLPGSVTEVSINRLEMCLLYTAIGFGILSMRRSLWYLVPCALAVCGFVWSFLY